jgi:hypothetical protein
MFCRKDFFWERNDKLSNKLILNLKSSIKPFLTFIIYKFIIIINLLFIKQFKCFINTLLFFILKSMYRKLFEKKTLFL